VDDSIVRVMLDRELVLRRARGYAPLPIRLKLRGGKFRASGPEAPGAAQPESVLAVGAHLKNAVAMAIGDQVFVSQHIGDLETEAAYKAFRQVIADFEKLYDAKPQRIAADLHPDYLSTKFAEEMSGTGPAEQSDHRTPKVIGVQHHIAHVMSCMAENEVEPPVLGVSWDGTGYGLDGTIWGGEFFLVTDTSVERVAHLRPFRLPGGDKAAKEPRRVALGLLHEMLGDDLWWRQELAPVAAFSAAELVTMRQLVERRVNAPTTSSVGRLFDAVASLVGSRQRMRFEGQAAMELEFALEGVETDESYELPVGSPGDVENQTIIRNPQSTMLLDWSPLVKAIMVDLRQAVSVGHISAKFHHALAESVVVVARRIGVRQVVLSGGCFQNRYLTERTVLRLRAEGFYPQWHQRVPPNDGGIALGQIIAARRALG
jgi:hydrogenase maturation protein HypF